MFKRKPDIVDLFSYFRGPFFQPWTFFPWPFFPRTFFPNTDYNIWLQVYPWFAAFRQIRWWDPLHNHSCCLMLYYYVSIMKFSFSA